MTLIGYFNSLRELGGMRRLVEDDVQGRLFRPGEENRGLLIIEELTSRKSAADIPQVLDQLGARRTSQVKRPARKPGEPYDAAADRRAAGDEHDLGRGRRAAPRRDGRRRPAQEHERVHPGHQPCRPRAPGARAHGLQLGAPARPLALRDVLPLPPHPLPAGRGAVGDAVRGARARPRPDRRTGVAATAVRAGAGTRTTARRRSIPTTRAPRRRGRRYASARTTRSAPSPPTRSASA